MEHVVPHIQVVKLHPVAVLEGAVMGPVAGPTTGGAARRKRVLSALLFLPAILTVAYAYLLAADRYVSETKFFIRSVRGSQGLLASAVTDASAGRSPADSHAVREFLMSRDALSELEKSGLVTATLARAGSDILWRYPGWFLPPNQEHLFRYYQSMLDVQYDTVTGIITMRISAFSPEAARNISLTLANQSEALLNLMEKRSKEAAVVAATAQVALATDRSTAAINKLRAFRERQLVVDPVKQTEQLFSTVSKLYLAQSEANARLRVLLRTAPNNPEINSIRTTIAALNDQISAERSNIAGAATALAPVIAEFETYSVESEFASRFLIQALTELEVTENDRRRQLLFFETVSGPSLPDYPAYPWRLVIALSALGLNAVLVFLLRVMFKDLFEHAQQ